MSAGAVLVVTFAISRKAQGEKMGQIIRVVTVAMLVLAFGHATAGEPTLADIRTQQLELRGKLERQDESLASLSDREREQFQAAQQRVFVILDRHDEADGMHPAARTRLTNELEAISALVEGAGKDRMVCKREKRTGSQRHVRVCKTVAQREQELEDARRAWNPPSPCSPGIGCTR